MSAVSRLTRAYKADVGGSTPRLPASGSNVHRAAPLRQTRHAVDVGRVGDRARFVELGPECYLDELLSDYGLTRADVDGLVHIKRLRGVPPGAVETYASIDLSSFVPRASSPVPEISGLWRSVERSPEG